MAYEFDDIEEPLTDGQLLISILLVLSIAFGIMYLERPNRDRWNTMQREAKISCSDIRGSEFIPCVNKYMSLNWRK